MRATGRQAFTLLEVLLVIAMLGILGAIIWPELGAASRGEQMGESVRRVKALIAMCRAEAMNESRRYRITIQLDGTLKVTCQRDPFQAPHEYIRVRKNWAEMQFILDDVWIESVLTLPEGPPPILLEDDGVMVGDDLLEFDDNMELEPPLLDDYEEPVEIDFEPDGSCSSIRFVLRSLRGQGVQLTLDGRLGRVDVIEVESIPRDQVEQPMRDPVEDIEDEFVEDDY